MSDHGHGGGVLLPATAVQGRLWPRDFQEFSDFYTAHRLRTKGKAPSPVTTRRKCGNLAVAALEARASSPSDLGAALGDRQQVETLLDLLSLRMSPGAMQTVVYSLLDFAAFARHRGWLVDCALQKTDIPPSNPDPAITVYSELEMERLVSAALGRGLRWFCFMAYLCDTGRRVGETLNLRWDWFRLEQHPPYVEVPTTKTDPQYVPLTKRLYHDVFTPETVHKLRTEPSRWRRSSHDHPFPWHYATVDVRFNNFCKTLGIVDRGFHNLRHTVLTDRLARGIPIQAVSKLAGHSSVATTDRRYNHCSALSFSRYVERDWKEGPEKP